MRDTLEKFRADEREHRDIALANDAEQAPGYRLLSAAIRAGCRIAIRLSERSNLPLPCQELDGAPMRGVRRGDDDEFYDERRDWRTVLD